jgi:microcystin-dependent protein
MDVYLGSITLFGFNWAPRFYAQCNGEMLPVNQMAALFSLLGTNFGGDGRTTFALPDLRGRVPCGFGSGPGLTFRDFAENFGAETAHITDATMFGHSHSVGEKQAGQTVTVNASDGVPDKSKPTGAYWGKAQSGTTVTPNYSSTHDTTMASDAVQLSFSNLVTGISGGSQPFDINPPTLALIYCVCTQGIFPSRP